MALTITFDQPRARRVKKGLKDAFITGSIAFDSSYPTGGESVTDISAKFKHLNRLVCDNASGYLFEYTHSTDKLVVRTPMYAAASAETLTVNNGLFKTSTSIIAVDGTGTAFGQQGIQVDDTTDLSGVTNVSFIAYGTL
jgi:hypothetical protein